jgi:ABC-2 type transport system ATP-binding protein
MRELLRELKNMGKTIFFSSHILSEVADVCTSIAILEAGELVAYGDMGAMKRRLRAHRLIEVRVLGDVARLQELFLRREDVGTVLAAPEVDLPPNVLRFDFSGSDADLSRLLAAIVNAGIDVVSFKEDTGNLEDVFMQATKGLVS